MSKLAPPSLTHNLRAVVPEPTGHILQLQITESPKAVAKDEHLISNLGAVKPAAPIAHSEDAGVPFLEAPAHLVTGSEMAKHLTPSLHARDHAYMTAPSELDTNDIIVGAWVYLDGQAPDSNMRTIFTNKASGCENLPDRHGFAMYVNAWETNNRQLYVEYGAADSGCHKLDSKGVKLLSNRWYHVALSFLGRTVTLFIDGSVVSEQTDVEPHKMQEKSPLLVGQYPGGMYPLYGNISHLAVVHTESTAQVIDVVRFLLDIRHIQKIPGLFALFPLKDAGDELPSSIAADIIGKHDGSYTFPPSASSKIVGLPFALVDGLAGQEPPNEAARSASDKLANERKDKIVAAMKHVWEGYKKYAWGRDELKPISRSGQVCVCVSLCLCLCVREREIESRREKIAVWC